jgi:hypothetical protein
MRDWTLVLGWGTPIGIGIFMVCIAVMVYLLSRATPRRKE